MNNNRRSLLVAAFVAVGFLILLALYLLLRPRATSTAAITCGGVNDTAAVQAAVDANSTVQFSPGTTCAIDGYKSIKLRSNKTLDMTGATMKLIAGCVSSGWPCRVFETIPGEGGITLRNGEVRGDFNTHPTGPGFSIGLRVDSSTPVSGARWSVIVDGTKFTQWRSDGIWLGGNTPATGVRLSGITVDGWGRNAISVTQAEDVIVERITCRNGKVGASPGACLGVEPNPAERMRTFHAFEVDADQCEVCTYLHKNTQAADLNYDIGIYRMRCKARKYGIILNETSTAALIGNKIESEGTGISIGAFIESARSNQVVVSQNDITGVTAIMLAGIKDSVIVGNNMHGGKVAAAALGQSGNMIIGADQSTQSVE
jgi:hypothetical protein